jgi:hypothetical protein
MSKLISGSNGAYASKSVYVDIATKSIATTEFDYNKEFSKMSKIGNFSTLSQRFTPDDIKESKSYSDDRSFWQRAENIKAGGGKSLSDFKNSMINYISLNTAAFSYAAGNTPNYHGPTQSSKINIAQSVTENLETMIHDFNVAGDFELNSGKIILLNIAPSEDPTAIKKNSKLGKSPTPGVDQFFSGNYVVTSVIHNFSEDYFASVRVKTDSFSNDFLTK